MMPSKLSNSLALIGLVTTLALSACQTDRIKEISSIEKGMTKAEVLGVAGGPQRTDRKRDQDIWTYVVPESRRDVLKEVDFSEGRVTYVGDPILAGGPSAAEQDRLNEESNAKSEAERRREQLLQQIGSSPKGSASSKAASPVPSDGNDDAVVETTPTPKPVFVPIDGGSAQ